MKITTTLSFMCVAAALAVSPDAGADCQSECQQDFPNACFNVKNHRWSKDDDGIARVRFRNRGQFGAAFDWAVSEINDPHVGSRAKIRVRPVDQDPDVPIFDTPNLCKWGSCGWWGIAYSWRSGPKTTRGKIFLSVDEMKENSATKDKIVQKHTMLHEIMHTLGMNHACVNNDHTMWACGMPDKDYVHQPWLTKCDVKGLIALYGEDHGGPTTDAAPENLLANGSFEAHLDAEEGPWGGWSRSTADGDSEMRRYEASAVLGDYGMRITVDGASGWNGVGQAKSVEPGSQLRLEANTRRRSGGAMQCLFALFFRWDDDGNPVIISQEQEEAGASTSWHAIGLDLTAPVGSEAVGAYAGTCETGSSSYDWDGGSLTER